jgi:hypothetical protein
LEIRHRQQLGLAIGEPLRAGQTLALRTVPVAAGIAGDAGHATIRTPLDMAAERSRPTRLDGRYDPTLCETQAAGVIGTISGVMAAEDVCHLARRPHAGRSARRHQHHQAKTVERACRVGDQRRRDVD